MNATVEHAGLDRLLAAVEARRERSRRNPTAAAAAQAIRVVPLDDALEVATYDPDPADSLLEAVRHVRRELSVTLAGLEGVSARRAERAARRITARAFLSECVGVSAAADAAHLIGCSVDSLERDARLLEAVSGGSAGLEVSTMVDTPTAVTR